MPKRSSRAKSTPRRGDDANEVAAKVIGRIVRITEEPPPKKNPAAVALGRMGGLKGGKARRDALTPERRSEIARKAGQARWKKNGGP